MIKLAIASASGAFPAMPATVHDPAACVEPRCRRGLTMTTKS